MQPLRRIRAVARKELAILTRDRFYLFMAVLLPVLTLIVMGYGIGYDIKNVPMGVVDLDRSAESRALLDTFVTSSYFRLAVFTDRPAALEQAMDAGRIRVGVVVPAGFSRDLHRGRPAEAQILVDGSFVTRAEIIGGYLKAIVGRFSADHLQAALQRAGPAAAPLPRVDVVTRIWFNPALESKNFLVPGLLVISLLFWTPTLVSLSVTREKETGAILNVQAAPLARWEFVTGKLLPYAAVSFASYWLLLLTSAFLFRVPVKGSLAVLTAAALLYVVGMTALGLLVSMVVRTQVSALLATGVIVMAVGLFYSGWLEPISSLDEKGQALSRLLPTADFLTLARGVFLKGLGAETNGGTLVRLAVYALLFVLASVLAFRKRVR